MLIRNIGAPRVVSSPAHDFYTDEIPHGGEIEVTGDLAKSLLDQSDVWERVKESAKAADKGEK